MSDGLELVRVVDRKTAIELTNLSARTFATLEANGEGPPKTRLSVGRIGYRVSDLRDWLDARRERPKRKRGRKAKPPGDQPGGVTSAT